MPGYIVYLCSLKETERERKGARTFGQLIRMFSQHAGITRPFLKSACVRSKTSQWGASDLCWLSAKESFSSFRCSAELLLHHPVLQTKPIPIVALPQYSQEFVANMHKNHKLPISVRLNDKKLRAAYGFDEGQCLDVDIDLWKEQAIHKTVDELVRRPFSPPSGDSWNLQTVCITLEWAFKDVLIINDQFFAELKAFASLGLVFSFSALVTLCLLSCLTGKLPLLSCRQT